MNPGSSEPADLEVLRDQLHLLHSETVNLLSQNDIILSPISSGVTDMKNTFQSADYLMAILDDISDAVVKLDGKANYVEMNKEAEETFQRLGKDPQSMIGKSVWEVYPEVKGTVVERDILRALEDEVWINYEFFYPGDQHWYQTNGYPSSPGVILVFRDITDRKVIS